jgi:hypothetical protein
MVDTKLNNTTDTRNPIERLRVASPPSAIGVFLYLQPLEFPGKTREPRNEMDVFCLVFGSDPVETNLLFDNLDACLKAEQTMRNEHARVSHGFF